MAFRIASVEDLPRLVDRLLAQPTSAGYRWVLEGARTDEDSRRALAEWAVHTTFDLGIIVLDDRGSVIGGRPTRLSPSSWRRLARGVVPSKPAKIIGRLQYPAELSTAVHERLFRLGQATALVTPPEGVMRVSFGLDVGETISDELFDWWKQQVAPTRTQAVTVGEEASAHLAARGFVRSTQHEIRGEPTLMVTSWLTE